MLAYKICPTLSLRVIGSERYLFRSRDRKGWEPKIARHPAFWQVWSLFSKPLTVDDALSKVSDSDKEVVTAAIEGMIECGLLEKYEVANAYDRILETPLFESQPQSVSYHLSSSRVDWIDYSNPKDFKKFDNEKMDEKVREEAIPANYKKARNSTPSYDL
ncbi:MAG TPA: SagB/ThcOx family dehydrogenase, partial [Clostridia bacterium]|nr:SagB/ThcOx family dehydrogenase [Clostridia bacterium]